MFSLYIFLILIIVGAVVFYKYIEAQPENLSGVTPTPEPIATATPEPTVTPEPTLIAMTTSNNTPPVEETSVAVNPAPVNEAPAAEVEAPKKRGPKKKTTTSKKKKN